MNYKQKVFETLCYTCLFAVIVLGLMTIIGTGGSSGNKGGNNSGVGEQITNSIGMTFNYIEPGTFMMGSPENELGREDNESQHEVILTQGYYMQTTPVTQGQWQAVIGSNPSDFSNCGSDCPVEMVSWNDVQGFISALNALEGTDRYVLPTEAQWEYAARAGRNTAFANGGITQYDDMSECNYSANLNAIGWYCYNSNGRMHPVAQKAPNAWGLYDMHGNAWEWVTDWYGAYPSSAVTDPTGPSSGTYRVTRGGSCYDDAVDCRSASRGYDPPGDRNPDVGFRVVLLPGHNLPDNTVTTIETLELLNPRPGVDLRYLLIRPESPTAAVILFAGSHGDLGLHGTQNSPLISWGEQNFLVRTRKQFGTQEFAVAVFDFPSDKKYTGDLKAPYVYRLSEDHATDVLAIANQLKNEFQVPVWLVGTSAGTFSTAYLGINLQAEISGIVLTAPLTDFSSIEDAQLPNAILDLQLNKVTVPTLIVIHEEDMCLYSPPAGVGELQNSFTSAPVVEVTLISGGKTAVSGPCDGLAPHGFYGKEQETVNIIAQFIKRNTDQND